MIINSYSSRTRRIWADIYNQRGRRLVIIFFTDDATKKFFPTSKIQWAASSGGLTISISGGKYIIFVLLSTRKKKSWKNAQKETPQQ